MMSLHRIFTKIGDYGEKLRYATLKPQRNKLISNAIVILLDLRDGFERSLLLVVSDAKYTTYIIQSKPSTLVNQRNMDQYLHISTKERYISTTTP